VVAALYGEHERPAPADLETDGDVWGQIALVVVQDGLHEVWELADVIGAQEPCHALAAPGIAGLVPEAGGRGGCGEAWRSSGLGPAGGLIREGVQWRLWPKGVTDRQSGSSVLG
jgi:hypothetical protein